jgi:cytidyltransferase-like protein
MSFPGLEYHNQELRAAETYRDHRVLPGRREFSDMALKKKVMVSGCFDLLHAGHVTFFETAAGYGDVIVCLGSDDNIRLLKQHAPRFNEKERLYLVQSIRHVKEARLATGSGYLDFEPDMVELKPDLFIVNEDGDHDAADSSRRSSGPFIEGREDGNRPALSVVSCWRMDGSAVYQPVCARLSRDRANRANRRFYGSGGSCYQYPENLAAAHEIRACRGRLCGAGKDPVRI